VDVADGGGAETLLEKGGVEAVAVGGAELGEPHRTEHRADPPIHVAPIPVLGVRRPTPLLSDLGPFVEQLGDGCPQAVHGGLGLAELHHLFARAVPASRTDPRNVLETWIGFRSAPRPM
jgi:hypothetical protein